ncbi:hypothetical protein PCANC_02841 [Puccinia coronata f. sp. avenae]|uniref:Uncharacterized protein n=1 Tax=Puccinia coronata f. sp. avenae TaxID=200324 RepID=A0A2N5W447_9BASI|nr:hypothetical protein PCANC_14266 [Puccinia coronata f. sp. avenae]PLW42267.1 hypothetical protein PCASD_07732 [Puccinia coronata f. sp. avenae]PLW57004.1 hypothetical protein PCANC_02841 [Puccinia coronata f. sp. avenae]
MRIQFPLHAHRPVSHPIFGPTIHRPTHLIPTVFQTKKPIPASLLPAGQIKLPPSSSSALSPKKLAKTKISTKIIRGILDSAVKKQVSVSSSSSIPNSHRHIWPQNLRVEDDWKGRGKWGEVRPDHLEWLGVPKKHKDLMLSLRAER